MGTKYINNGFHSNVFKSESPSSSEKSYPDPRISYYINILFPPWYLLTIVSVWYYGFVTVFPYLYLDAMALLAHRLFSVCILLEMMVNWICIKFVDSTFGRPPGTRHGRPRPRRLGAGDSDDTPLVEPSQQCMTTRNGDLHSPEVKQAETATKYYRTSDGSVIVAMPSGVFTDGDDKPKMTTYPYFAWKPCLVCDRMRPPRCHHCALCKKCVLKRDHHCYFAGACVGLYNQRHFIVFTFWASIASVYAFLHSLPYIYHDFLSQTSFWDLFLPLTYLRWFFNFTSFKIAILMTMEWSLMCFVYLSVTFFWQQIVLVSRSLTTFENDNRMNLRDSRDFQSKVRAVFGDHWPVHFIIPLHMWFDPLEDAINWPYISKDNQIRS